MQHTEHLSECQHFADTLCADILVDPGTCLNEKAVLFHTVFHNNTTSIEKITFVIQCFDC